MAWVYSKQAWRNTRLPDRAHKAATIGRRPPRPLAAALCGSRQRELTVGDGVEIERRSLSRLQQHMRQPRGHRRVVGAILQRRKEPRQREFLHRGAQPSIRRYSPADDHTLGADLLHRALELGDDRIDTRGLK